MLALVVLELVKAPCLHTLAVKSYAAGRQEILQAACAGSSSQTTPKKIGNASCSIYLPVVGPLRFVMKILIELCGKEPRDSA